MNFWTITAALILCSCGVGCPLDLRTAVTVEISSPEGLPISGVTASHSTEASCELWSEADAGTKTTYTCWEQGEGTYTIRVKSDSLTWTKQVDVDGDGCHVTEQPTVAFVLEARTAD